MVKKSGVARFLRRKPGHEEACDERSKPQDVTSTWTGREGINLPEEVVPQARRKISSQLPIEGYRRKEFDGRNEHTGARPESTALCAPVPTPHPGTSAAKVSLPH